MLIEIYILFYLIFFIVFLCFFKLSESLFGSVHQYRKDNRDTEHRTENDDEGQRAVVILHSQGVDGNEQHDEQYQQGNNPAEQHAQLLLALVAWPIGEGQVDAAYGEIDAEGGEEGHDRHNDTGKENEGGRPVGIGLSRRAEVGGDNVGCAADEPGDNAPNGNRQGQ